MLAQEQATVTSTATHLLELRAISKVFPGVRALSDVDLALDRGEILAVVGENGAGKSTLMKITGGVYQPDNGEIRVDGEVVTVPNVQRAAALGIAFVHQELNLSDNLDVAENVYLGREPRIHGIPGLIDRRKLYDETRQVLGRVSLDIDPKTIVHDLSIGSQQMIEIARALSMNARILIMDEPTSSLSATETENLFTVLHELRRQGVGIIYISHRLGEVKEIADRVTVLRDGKNAGELSRQETDAERIIKCMVGRDIEKYYDLNHTPSTNELFRLEGIITERFPKEKVSLTVNGGEILVLAGLIGAGRTELLHAVFGIEEAVAGSVWLDGKRLSIRTAWEAIHAGIGLVPEDRKQNGLILEMALDENITLPGLPRYQRIGFMDFREMARVSEDMVRRLSIRSHSVQQIVETLSGGNQQKAVLAKWLSLNPKVLLLDEPTRGIDVVAKEEVYRLMRNLAHKGVAMLVVSSEMHEVLGIADRIAVMHEGRIEGELRPDEFSEEAIMTLATGGIPS